MLRIFGKKEISILKDTQLEKLAQIDTAILTKTRLRLQPPKKVVFLMKG